MNREKLALKKFYEDVGEHYPEEEQVYHTLRGMLRKKFILSRINRFRGSLLEIGCNRGMYLQAYRGGTRFGVDLSLSVLKHAHQEKTMHLAVADAERLQCFKTDSFQNVLCSEVLEHCLHPQEIFAGIGHVLRPGGTALLTTPNYRRKKPVWIGLGTLTHFGIDCDCGDAYFHTAYRPEELAAMAEKSGLAVIEIGTLEKEIKYAAKIPAAILIFGRMLNKILKSEKFDAANEAFFNHLTIWIYQICHFSGLEKLLLKFVPEGVRSFIIMQKKTEEVH